MSHLLACLAVAFLLSGCGVKLPPIAPERPLPPPPPPKLDCSPQDPTCDRTDPNYRPQNH